MFKCFLRPPFGSTACGANLVVFYYGLKLATRCASSGASGASWKGFLCRLSSMLSVTAWGYLIGATKRPMVGQCLCWTWRYLGEDTLQIEVGCHQYWTWSSSVKSLGNLRSANACQLSIRLKNFQELSKKK